ncbi:MAG: nucleoside phosphorylase [Deltaproteobacteria bacterium]|nr:nucleoside phosphorylase [Deltaproteobacteria bacterium]
MATYESAEVVKTATGRQYHIGCGPGDVAPYILLCGDPARVHRVAKYFDQARAPITHREYVTITGMYRGIPLTVMATGMGPDNTEIAVVELSQIVQRPTLLRIGSCGAIRQGIELAELVISTGAVRLENTTSFYVVDGYPAVAHHEAVVALIEAAARCGFPHHLGITATAPGFYACQARKVPGFPVRDPELPAKLESMGVANFEMEASALFTLGSIINARAGAVCAVYANRHLNQFIDDATMQLAEQRCIETGLAAIEVLAAMDQKKGAAAWWTPSHGL